ncbi:gas vesicle protein GvpN [Bradyrhizobium oligotrophicum]|uniref:gas vesicle protein GvpN n=1 Tax=Bradyrhizobium oligotrophicum TaxID=44255 RepID=UPI001FCB7B4F|nr:gas vesicle protein GvpN [Bradyrhizobium oligotrophicum]
MTINQDSGRRPVLRSDRAAIAGGQRGSRAQGDAVARNDAAAGSRAAIAQISPRPDADNAALSPAPRTDLFENPQLASMAARALTYLNAGIPVHLRGPAGTGKTTMAMQLAARLGRPVVLLTGDDGLTAAHLVGREIGTKSRQVVDRYVHSVRRVETETSSMWCDAVLAQAVVEGLTFVYDEFTRSPPQANNPLLSVVEERILIFPAGSRKERLVHAHPEFRAILTSNPEEYAGVSRPQDALLDRLITFDLDDYDRETEIGIVSNRTGLAYAEAGVIVDLVRGVRRWPKAHHPPSMRSAIMIARIVARELITPSVDDPRFVRLCLDVLAAKAKPTDRDDRDRFAATLLRLMNNHCPAGAIDGG